MRSCLCYFVTQRSFWCSFLTVSLFFSRNHVNKFTPRWQDHPQQHIVNFRKHLKSIFSPGTIALICCSDGKGYFVWCWMDCCLVWVVIEVAIINSHLSLTKRIPVWAETNQTLVKLLYRDVADLVCDVSEHLGRPYTFISINHSHIRIFCTFSGRCIKNSDQRPGFFHLKLNWLTNFSCRYAKVHTLPRVFTIP